MKWSATIAEDGTVTLAPDTPETRRAYAETVAHLFSGDAEIERAEIVDHAEGASQ